MKKTNYGKKRSGSRGPAASGRRVAHKARSSTGSGGSRRSSGRGFVAGRSGKGAAYGSGAARASGARPVSGAGITAGRERSGQAADPLAELEELLYSRREFPEKAAAEAMAIPQVLTEEKIAAEVAKGRRDLRDKVIVTIDGADTRDVDDGVSLERTDNGGWLLGVHIADVAHYVKKYSPLDNEAYRRGTSVYFPDKVLPMLPKELSNGICSLNVGEDRFALSVSMELDPSGEVVSHEIFESVVNVRYKITYEQYYDLFEGPEPRCRELRKAYSPYIDMLTDMKALAELRRAIRKKRGALDFEFPETKISIGQNGEPDGVYPAELTFANGVIEEFMLLANETVAAHFEALGVPFIYRNHPAPTREKLEELDATVRRFGYTLLTRRGELIPGSISDMIDSTKESKSGRLIQTLALTSMGKAVYSSECRGHFGLASEKYTHFTSPIRRYPDLYIHRVIKESIYGARPATLRERFPDAEEAAEASSDAEREAERAERLYTDKLAAKYMAGFLGESFVGTVSGMTSFGLFITLDNSAEGLLFYADMPDQMVFDPKRLIAKGRFTGRTFRYGDRVEVVIASSDEKTGRIQFQFG